MRSGEWVVEEREGKEEGIFTYGTRERSTTNTIPL
jgi:hypothetical protein